MNEIYWITRLGIVANVFSGILIMGGIIITALFISTPAVLECYGYLEERGKSICIKLLKGFCFTMVFSALGTIFVPTQNEMFLIYGIGGTIDYIKSNDKAKELPDKVIDALDRYIDTLNDNDKEE